MIEISMRQGMIMAVCGRALILCRSQERLYLFTFSGPLLWSP